MSRISDSDEQIPLSDQFTNPLNLVSELTVDSSSEVENIFISLESRISQNDDWQRRSSAIQEAMSYIKGGIHNFPDSNFALLAPGIASCVTNLRSALVRWGSLYVACAAQVLQVNFVSSLEIIIPALFKQLSHGTAVISNSCRFALLEVSKNVPHRRTARAFLSKLKSKSPPQRQAVTEFIQIAVINWPSPLLTSLSSQFSDALKILVEDPSPAVRSIAREASEAMSTFNSPSSTNSGSDNARPSSRSNLRGLQVKIPSQPTTPRNQHHVSHIPTSPLAKARTPAASFKRRSVDESPPTEKVSVKDNRKKSLRTSQIPFSPKFNGEVSSPASKSSNFPSSNSGPMTQPTIRKVNSIFDESQSDDNDDSDDDFLSSPKTTNNVFKFAKIPPPIGETTDKHSKMKDIDEYMPPKTHKDSENFLKLLIEITSSEDYSRLDGLDVLLPPSIVSAVKYLPDIERWKAALPILFAQFPDAFDDSILELISAFNYSPWLINQFALCFDLNATANTASQNISLESLHFFAALLKGETSPIVSQNILSIKFRKKLIKIANSFPEEPDSKFLKEKITGKQEPGIIDKLIAALEHKEGCHEILENILNILDNKNPANSNNNNNNSKAENNNDILHKIEPVLVQYLSVFNNGSDENGGNRDQVISLLEFVLNVLKKKKEVCFPGIFLQLSELALETERTIVDLASEVMVKMAELDSSLIIALMQRVEEAMNTSQDETALSTLGIIHQFFKNLPENKMGDFTEPVMQHLQPALASNNTSVRRIVVLIFVEFRYKIPQKFHQYMEQLSMTQQKLIELYSSKRGPKK